MFKQLIQACQVIRSYGMDVSRLLDVCRESVVFKSLRDLSTCLAAMAADSDVALLRVKNRFDPAYDSASSGGYRDVQVCLSFTSAAAAVRLGLDRHVCEVQLLLRATAELKSDAGHRHYVECRNLRAD